MTRIIIGGRTADEVIKKRLADIAHSGDSPPPPPPPDTILSAPPTIEALVTRGIGYYSNAQENGKLAGVAKSLEDTIAAVGVQGIATMPLLVAGKTRADKTTHFLWKEWTTAYSQEYVGIDCDGILVARGQPVVVVVHGNGILGTPARIRAAYAAGLTNTGAATLDNDTEFAPLVHGIVNNEKRFQLYTIDDIEANGISDPCGQYAVWIPLEEVKRTKSGRFKKAGFCANKLVRVRCGTKQYLSAFFDKAKDRDGEVGNWHYLAQIDPQQARGRVLFLGGDSDGLNGRNSLYDLGRFVGVAPEAR